MALAEEGYTQRVIAARVGCTQASVSGILKKMVYGNVKDAKIPGQKRKTSQKEDRIVVRKSKADRFKTASQIKAEIDYDVDISVSTTRRRLRETNASCIYTPPHHNSTSSMSHSRLNAVFV